MMRTRYTQQKHNEAKQADEAKPFRVHRSGSNRPIARRGYFDTIAEAQTRCDEMNTLNPNHDYIVISK